VPLGNPWHLVLFTAHALQLTNVAWMDFLVQGLYFSTWEMGLASIIGTIVAILGMWTYKSLLFDSDWKMIYLGCTIVTTFSTVASQLLLVFGLNFKVGMPETGVNMGGETLVDHISALQVFPIFIMYLGLCPTGLEAMTNLFLTSWSSMASSLSYDISTTLVAVLVMSCETIAHDYGGVWRLSLLCGVLGLVPLFLLGSMMPKNKLDQDNLLLQDKSQPFGAAVTILLIAILALILTYGQVGGSLLL
jgi:hypothetical protein